MDAPVFLFDVDGVIVRFDGFFTPSFCESRGLPSDFFDAYFREKFQSSIVWTQDARENMKLYLAGTEMEGKESEVMEFWFEHDSGFDHEVLAIIDLLRAAGHPVGLATNQEKYRMAHLLAHPALRDRIDAAYPSWEAGYKKPDTRYFQAVNRAVYDRFGARRIIFVDDLAANVETARELDWEAHCFLQDEPDAIAKLESFLAPYLAAETRE